jgi:hypothetical protein
MSPERSRFQLVAGRRAGRRVGVIAAAMIAIGASPAAAQYGADPPLPPLPPLPTASPPAPPAPAAAAAAPAPAPAPAPSSGSGAPAPAPPAPAPSGVEAAVGSGGAVPAAGTKGPVRDTDVAAPAVQVVSDERSAPAAIEGDDLPFTGASLGLFALIGGALVALGLGVRRRTVPRATRS